MSNLKVFGCLHYAHIPDSQGKKFDQKSLKAIFVGYPQGTKGYKLYDLNSKLFLRSRNVIFHEDKFHDFQSNNVNNEKDIIFQELNESGDGIELSDNAIEPTIPQVQPVLTEQLVVNSEPVGATYEETFMRQVNALGPQRQRNVPQRFHPDSCFVTESLTSDIIEPKSVKEALSSEHSVQWKNAMSSEYSSLIKNDTLELVPPPNDKNIVGSKWDLKVKIKADGTVDRFKARLVAQGYSPTHGIDYDEVFSPVAKYSAIRSLLALANAHNLEVHQMDVKTAFLNGLIDCDIYMSQPESFIDPDRPNFVCKLNKSIYGLKQSARCWNTTLDEFLTSTGCRKSKADDCIYIKQVKNSDGQVSFVILAVCVDDMIPVSNDQFS